LRIFQEHDPKMKKTKQPKTNHMLIGVYFNISYEQYWQQAWLHYCDSKKEMLLYDYIIKINYDIYIFKLIKYYKINHKLYSLSLKYLDKPDI